MESHLVQTSLNLVEKLVNNGLEANDTKEDNS